MLSSPPSTNKYGALKTRILASFGLTRRDRAYKLLHLRQLGDRKPSELMDEMLSLLQGHKFCFLAEQLFLEQLPDELRISLASSDFSNACEVATTADALWLAKQLSISATISKVTSQHRTSQVSTDNTESDSQAPDKQNWCYFHKRFGGKARKCTDPCDYKKNPGVSNIQGRSESHILYIKDMSSGRQFLVDTGAVGGILEQHIDGPWKPLAFFSRKLRPPEVKYSAFDRELLGIYLSIRHIRYFLEARPFTIYTDHKPLALAFAKASDPFSPRQQRHLSYISEFSTDIHYSSHRWQRYQCC